jgi:hypothetical protein
VVAALAGGGSARVIFGAPPFALALVVSVAIGAIAAGGLVGIPDAEAPTSQVGTSWWEGPNVRPVAPSPTKQVRTARDVFCYLPYGRTPQCPRCGGFDGHFRFLCTRCAHGWEWSLDEPWPPVRLDPRLRS